MPDISDFFNGGFDTSTVEPTNFGNAMPAGDYMVEIEKAEVRPTKAKDGHYIWLQLTVIGEKYNGKKLFKMINVDNKSQKAMEIGLGELSALGKAINDGNDMKVGSVDQLLSRKVGVRVKVTEDGEDNDIAAFKPVSKIKQNTSTAKASPSTPPFQQQSQVSPGVSDNQKPVNTAGASTGKPPWMK